MMMMIVVVMGEGQDDATPGAYPRTASLPPLGSRRPRRGSSLCHRRRSGRGGEGLSIETLWFGIWFLCLWGMEACEAGVRLLSVCLRSRALV